MPTKEARKRVRRTTKHKSAAAKATQTHGESAKVETNVAVYGVYPDRVQTKRALDALRNAGFTFRDISASSLAPVRVTPLKVASARPKGETEAEVESMIGTAARITGGVLGLSTLAVAAPVMIAAPVVGAFGFGVGAVFNGLSRGRMPVPEQVQAQESSGVLLTVNCDNKKMAKRAAATLESTGAEDVALTSPEYLDLKTREYRDEEGNIRHHTHAYLREHGETTRSSEA